MSDTQNQPAVEGAQELLTEDPNVQQPTQPENEFEDFIQRANTVLSKQYDVIVPTTQEEMVFVNETIKLNDQVKRTLNIEREQQRKYEMQGYQYPLKTEIKDLLEKMERASNEYEVRAQEYLQKQKDQAEKEAADRLAESKANANATVNLIPMDRPDLPPVNLGTPVGGGENGEQPDNTQQNPADEMAPSGAADSGQPANTNNPEGQTVEEQVAGQAPTVEAVDPNASGASDGSGGHQTPATGQPPQPKPELQGDGVQTNTENLQNLEEGGQGASAEGQA